MIIKIKTKRRLTSFDVHVEVEGKDPHNIDVEVDGKMYTLVNRSLEAQLKATQMCLSTAKSTNNDLRNRVAELEAERETTLAQSSTVINLRAANDASRKEIAALKAQVRDMDGNIQGFIRDQIEFLRRWQS